MVEMPPKLAQVAHAILLGWVVGYVGVVARLASQLRAGARQLRGPSLRRAAGDPRENVSARHWPLVHLVLPISSGDCFEGLTDTTDGTSAYAMPAYAGQLRIHLLAMADDVMASARAERHSQALQARNFAAEHHRTLPAGPNRKAAQLAQLPHFADESFVLVLDSDVRPSSVAASALVVELMARPKLALVWQPAVPGRAPRTWGDRVAAAILCGSAHAMPVLAELDGASPVGKVVLYRPAAVAAVGGWACCLQQLGEDVALGARLRAHGFAVAALSAVAKDARGKQTLAAVCSRMARWASVLRQQRPATFLLYPGWLCATPLQAGLSGLLVCCGQLSLLSGALLATASWLARLWLGRMARSCAGGPDRLATMLLDMLLADAVLLAAMASAVLRRRVVWHGHEFAPGETRRRATPSAK